MPALSWNEIYQRAIQFSRDWKGVEDERAEAQTFWNEFFHVFGIRRRTVASFEEPVKSLKNTYHRIDLFWKGRLLAEHKSVGGNLDKAGSQAFQYIQELAASNRNNEIPRYVVLSDFNRMVLYDLEPEEGDHKRIEFLLADLPAHNRDFAFLIGQKVHRFGEEDPANIEAAAIMANLHDAIAESHYDKDALERLLVRLLFCLFADDTGIFEPAQFELFIQNRTGEDGSDLGAQLNALFDVLNSPGDKRPKYLEEDLAAFPYVNGELFAEHLSVAGFNKDMRNALVAACRFDWSRISPAIFGSLFQGIMDAKERRQIGAHYTSERDILKVIRPLFLDALREEFKQIDKDRRWGHRDNRLKAFREKLTKLRFLDPACGCGNFLVIAYRELRRLEHDVLACLYNFCGNGEELGLGEESRVSRVDVHQFYGIEIGKWPARIAETALWLTDHQMNTEISKFTGNLFQRIPLRAAPHIRCANALRFDWNELLPGSECSYVLGNPPFVGKQYQTDEQKADMRLVWGHVKGSGVLDYVTCWYLKATEYLGKKRVPCAFVSTNSITQGEQVGILWSALYPAGIRPFFAHRTFAWKSEARGAAHVHVVIIGFMRGEPQSYRMFDYVYPEAEPSEISVGTINPYLVDAPFTWVTKRRKPICHVKEMNFGNMPNDGGHLLLSEEERDAIVTAEPELEPFIKRVMGSREFINGLTRYCFWLVDAPPSLMKTSETLKLRIRSVKAARSASPRATTRALVRTPALFGEIRQPGNDYIAIPEVSSERRSYIPMGFLGPNTIATNKMYQIPDATLWEFGIVQSAMHMAWIKSVAGRLKSDIQYSAGLVYNNFPWPMEATAAQRAKVEECAQRVLDVRQGYLDSNNTLAQIYDPLLTPVSLVKAHWALDRAVDRCYRREAFHSERERVEYLFQLYEQLTAPLAPAAPTKKTRRGRIGKAPKASQA